jgi:hypothetical protein
MIGATLTNGQWTILAGVILLMIAVAVMALMPHLGH